MMLRIIPFLLIMLFNLGLAWSQDQSSVFEQGMAALVDEKYTSSIELFEQELAQNKTFEAYYNLGLSYAGKEDWMKALWAFESAIKLQPTNKDALFNAEYVLDKINPQIKWSHPYNWTKRVVLAVPLVAWYLIAFLSSVLVGVLMIDLIARKRWLGSPSISFGLALVFVGVFFITYGAGYLASNHYNEMHYVLPIEKSVITFASEQGVQLDASLEPGMRYLFVDETADMVKLQFTDEFPVWVAKEQVGTY